MIRLSAGATFVGVDARLPSTGEAAWTLRLADAARAVGAHRRWFQDRLPIGARVGLVFKTSPELVLGWLGAMAAGLEPCVLHYPTAKLSRTYWLESTRDTLTRCDITAVVTSPGVVADGLRVETFVPGALDPAPPADAVDAVSGTFLQLSSGTTGQKKPTRCDLATAVAHVHRYNRVLGLGHGDCLASWLPLYHDMGFIACFVLPMTLGLPAVLMDPMTWTASPSLLFDAIRRFSATACWMPNFGFEVMARHAAGPLPTVRHWISCSEPSRADTLERFCRETGAPPSHVSTCYAMAENVFAVSQSAGLVAREIDGQPVVSCGRLLPDTTVKVVDGEILVRSPSSLTAYAGGPYVADADGFYPTGDLGSLVDGELFVTGRKHDVMVTAGQKHLLSDLDHHLNRVTACGGRGAALADRDPRVPGTEMPTFLVERPEFWDKTTLPSVQKALTDATGLATIGLHYVPPAFITKTSSGKIKRRRTLADWHACAPQVTDSQVRGSSITLDASLAALFPDLPADAPLGEALDSLGTVTLQLLLEEHGLEWKPDVSLDHLLRARSGDPTREASGADVLSVVVLADWDYLGWMDDGFARELAGVAGVPVQIDHVCAPPSFALLGDLIFHDYFMPRDTTRDYRAVASCLRRIKQASLLVMCDMGELWFPSFDLGYPTLSHRFERQEAADRMGFRWTPYIANHHTLPIEVVDHQQHPAVARNVDLARLSHYLGIPIFRRATTQRFAAVTQDWESRALRSDDDVLLAQHDDAQSMRRDLTAYVRRMASTLRRVPGLPQSSVAGFGDRHHFCSNVVNPAAIDFLVDQPYQTYVLSGVAASVPALAARLRARGRTVRYSRTLRVGDGPVDCVVQTGTWGVPETTAPVYELMNAGRDRGRPLNVPADVADRWPGWKIDWRKAA